MSQLTLLHGARQLLTLRGPHGARRGSALRDLGVIEDGSILIENGVIKAVGPTRRLENLKAIRTATAIDVSGSIILPGLIDPDLRFTFGEAKGGRDRRVSVVQESGASLLRSCLQHGTLTAVLNVSAEAEDPRADLSLLRQATKITGNPVDIVRNWHIPGRPSAASELSLWHHSLQTVVAKRFVDAVTITLGSDTAVAREWLSAVLEMAVPVTLRWNGGDFAALRSALEQIRPRSFYLPSVLKDSEVELLAESPGTAVFAPSAQIQPGTEVSMRKFVDAGGALALSSGYHPVESPGFSMQIAISLAIMQGQLTAEEAISAATVNGAHVAGRGHVTGTLEVGKRADLVIMSVPHYRDIARQFGINHVDTVLRDGAVVYNRGRWKILANDISPGRVRSQSVGRS